MVTRSNVRVAGLLALGTSASVAASLVLFQGGPPADHGNAVLDWFGREADLIRVSAAIWLVAMIGLVAFAIAFREAMWASIIDRPWMATLFVQGSGVFATIVVVSAALSWTLADQASTGSIAPELAGTLWAVERTLLRFATWGLTAPLVVVGLSLYPHSVLGQLCTVSAVLVAGALLVPFTWGPAVFAFCAWLALAGVTMLVPASGRVSIPEMINR